MKSIYTICPCCNAERFDMICFNTISRWLSSIWLQEGLALIGTLILQILLWQESRRDFYFEIPSASWWANQQSLQFSALTRSILPRILLHAQTRLLEKSFRKKKSIWTLNDWSKCGTFPNNKGTEASTNNCILIRCLLPVQRNDATSSQTASCAYPFHPVHTSLRFKSYHPD